MWGKIEFFLHNYNVYQITFWSVDFRIWYPLSDDLTGWCTIEDVFWRSPYLSLTFPVWLLQSSGGSPPSALQLFWVFLQKLLPLGVPNGKKSQGARSGERTGYGTSPWMEIRQPLNISLKTSIDWRAVCEVVGSCWKISLWSLTVSVFGFKNVVSISV